MLPRWYPAFLFSLLIPFFLAGPAAGQSGGRTPVVRVGLVIDGPWERNDAVVALIREEIHALTVGEFDVRFPEEKRLEGDWTVSGVARMLDRQLADPGVDVVITLGGLASDNASRRGALPKPVIAPFVIDPVIQGLPMRDGASGVRNLSYLAIPSTLPRDVRAFLEIVPFTKLTILANQAITESIPGLRDRMRVLLGALGVEASFLAVGSDVAAPLAAIPPETEAVYILPLLQLSGEDFDALIAGLNQRRLPTFSYFGEEEVKRGVMAGLNPDLFPRISRRVALNLQRILLGEEAGSIPSAFSAGERLMINIGTAEAIGAYPNWAVITEAELVGGTEVAVDRRLDLAGVMQEALRVNLDVAAADRLVSAGAHEVKKARANLLPQIDVSATGILIDEDRATNSFGSQAERTLSGTATLSQVLFSDPALANYSIAGNLQESREEERRQTRLDVVQQAANAYLNLLRAKTFERIQRENLALSRTNLELSRVRQAIGQSGPSDVLRWESEIATNRRSAIAANAQRNLAEMELNRLLHRPLEEDFETEDITISNTDDLLGDYPYLPYFNDKISFQAFRDFMVEEGFRRSPELKSLEATIAAVSRSLRSATRAFTLPTLALQGSVTNRFETGGAGSDVSGGGIIGLDPIDETDWSLGLQLSYPLFSGGGKFAERARAREQLHQLELQQRAAVERIEQRIRSAHHLAGSSFAGIQQAFKAADAASKNLDLVTDSYSRGAVSIIDLLDAQNAHIVATQGAANSVYDFLIDLKEIQRSVSRFDALVSPESQQVFLERLEQHMTARGVRPRR